MQTCICVYIHICIYVYVYMCIYIVKVRKGCFELDMQPDLPVSYRSAVPLHFECGQTLLRGLCQISAHAHHHNMQVIISCIIRAIGSAQP